MYKKISNMINLSFVFLFVVFYSFTASASDISALNFNGDLIGKVIPDGTVVNQDNEVIGHMNADGLVLDAKGIIIGGIVPQGVAISNTNTKLGKVNNDGSVTGQNDTLVGKVLPNGLVVNDNYDILGSVIAPGLVYNDLGTIIGRVSGDGVFYNLSGVDAGFVAANGYVFAPNKDNKLELAGKLISSKIVTSFYGDMLGGVTPDGRVTDLKKQVIGKIHANGYAYNPDGKIIGSLVKSGYAFDFNGNYLGIISYNGHVISNSTTIGYAIDNNRIIDKKGNVVGFSVPLDATANTNDGRLLGYIIPGGEIIKGRDVIGKINASADIIDNEGKKIGSINGNGPIFDFQGKVRANVTTNGVVTTLDGVQKGFIQKDIAYDYNGNEEGRLLSSVSVFNNANQYLGMSGINSRIEINDKIYTLSPYGYVFNEEGNSIGHSVPNVGIYTPEGNILANMSVNALTDKPSLNKDGKIDGYGNFFDKNNKLLGKIIKDRYATNFMGESIGLLNQTNNIINEKNERIAKILPTGAVVELNGNIRYDNTARSSSLNMSINGDFLGASYDNGGVVKEKQTIGRVTSNGYVVDNMGSLYGATIPYATAVTPTCSLLGVVSNDGSIRNAQNTYIGRVLPNKQVINDSEEIIGYIVEPNIVIGEKGEIIGSQNSFGEVLNYKNENLGCQDVYGLIRNSQNEVIGRKNTFVTAINFENKVIGYTDIAGKVIDASGTQIGLSDINGDIWSNNNEILGVLFDYKFAFDENNIYIGRINSLGDIISDNSDKLGTVSYAGEVTTNDGKSGYALYDLYAYNNDGFAVGYIAKNGQVFSFNGNPLGSIYNGFVIDKRNNLIARGNRDYNIRNNQNKTIGKLNFDGAVVNNKNVKIGYLSATNGEIIDDNNNVIAKAHYLQYYKEKDKDKEDILDVMEDTISDIEKKDVREDKVAKDGVKDSDIINEENIRDEDAKNNDSKEVEGAKRGGTNKSQEATSSNENDDKKSKAIKTKLNHKIIGIAITPGGKYIGDVYDNKEVIDEEGNIVARTNNNGEIVDEKGTVVGYTQKAKEVKSEDKKDNSWWKKVADGTTVSAWRNDDSITNVGPGGGVGPSGRYNPQRAAILNQLHQDRRQNLSGSVIQSNYSAEQYTGWQDDWGISKEISTLRVDMSYVITADKPIPAVLARSLVSIGNAPITAIVERNIYADQGRNVIIPAGSRIIGGLQEVDSESRFDGTTGGVKIEITWDRIIRPDGISFMIGSSTTGDAQGRGGGALGYVDEQLVKKYTLPLVGTMVTSAITYMMAADEESTGQVENSKQQAAADARQMFMEKMDEILQEIIEKKKEIEPVTYIPAGTRVIIYPMVDLWLRSTKNIEKGEESKNAEVVNKLVGDEETSTNVNSNQTQTTVNGNNQKGQQPHENPPLMADDNNQQKQQQQIRRRALPPPSADGSDIMIPNEEDEDSGEIDLSF